MRSSCPSIKSLALAGVLCGAAGAGAAPVERRVYAHHMGCWPAVSCQQEDQGLCDRGLKAALRGEKPCDCVSRVGGRIVNKPLLPYVYRTNQLGACKLEIRRALRAGLDGFAIDAWSGDSSPQYLDTMFRAAEEMKADFGITICFDPGCHGAKWIAGEKKWERYVSSAKWVLRHLDSPNLARFHGKPLFFGYYSKGADSDHPAGILDAEHRRFVRDAWTKWRKALPCEVYLHGSLEGYVDYRNPESNDYEAIARDAAATYESVGAFIGIDQECNWGDCEALWKAVRKAGCGWSQPLYWQYSNKRGGIVTGSGLENLHRNWTHAIERGSELLQFVTWNDYGEETVLAPCYGTGYTLSRVNRWYAERWKTGRDPEIAKDEIHVVFRRTVGDAPSFPFLARRMPVPEELEVVAFLREPARVTVDGYGEYPAEKGMSVKRFPLHAGPVAARAERIMKDGSRQLVCAVRPPEKVVTQRWREDMTAVAYGSNFEDEWRLDFPGERPLAYSENGDADGDGLPNWFEMVYFGTFPDMRTATIADPDDDPDGDGATNREEYRRETNPLKADTPYRPGFVWRLSDLRKASDIVGNPARDAKGRHVWRCTYRFGGEKEVYRPGEGEPFTEINSAGGSVFAGGRFRVYLPNPKQGNRRVGGFNTGVELCAPSNGAARVFVNRDTPIAVEWISPVDGTVGVELTTGAAAKGRKFHVFAEANGRLLEKTEVTADAAGRLAVEGLDVSVRDRVRFVFTTETAGGFQELPVRDIVVTLCEPSGQHTVFAHYMTCFGKSVDDYKYEIALAQQYGIGGWALNCGNWMKRDPKTGEWKPHDGYIEKASRIFRAAEELGTDFKLFFSPDGSLNTYTNGFHADMLLRFKDHPNHFRYGGRPFFSGWGGGSLKNEKYAFARRDFLERGLTNVCLVPELGPTRNVMFATKDLVAGSVFRDPHFACDGSFLFGCDNTTRELVEFLSNSRFAALKAGKIFMAGPCPSYNSSNLRDYRGFAGYAAEWSAICADQPELVEIVTWNDYAEDSALVPSSYDYRAKRIGTRIINSRDESFLDLTAYCAAAYRAGGVFPPIEQEKLLTAYRPRPKRLTRVYEPDPSKGPRQPRWLDMNDSFLQIHDDVQDCVYATVLLREPAEVTIAHLRGSETVAPVTQWVEAGIHTLEAPMVPGATPEFSVARGGRTLLKFLGRRLIAEKETVRNSFIIDRPIYSGGQRMWTGGGVIGDPVLTLKSEGNKTAWTLPKDFACGSYGFRIRYVNAEDDESRYTLYVDVPWMDAKDPNHHPVHLPLYLPPTGGAERELDLLLTLPRGTTGLRIVRDDVKGKVTCRNNGQLYTSAFDYSDWGSARVVSLALVPNRIAKPMRGVSDDPETVAIPGGTFTMSARAVEPDEGRPREVTVAPFLMGKYEVTNREFERFMPEHASHRTELSWRDRDPVIYVSWNEAVDYCNWLSDRQGLTRAYAADRSSVAGADGYRLPTESEWEYVASGRGENRLYPWGNEEPTDELCNFAPASVCLNQTNLLRPQREMRAVPVGSYPRGVSRDGVHDLAGNVCEWCNDAYNAGRNFRAIRGGSFGYYNMSQRVCDREFNNAGYQGYVYIGFRVVRSLPKHNREQKTRGGVWVLRRWKDPKAIVPVSRTVTKRSAWRCPADGRYDVSGEFVPTNNLLFSGRLLRNGEELCRAKSVGPNFVGVAVAENVALKSGDVIAFEVSGTDDEPKPVKIDSFAVRRRCGFRSSYVTAPDAVHAHSGRVHEGIPSVAEGKDGRLWITWYATNGAGCETSGNYVILACSEDGGETWREVAIADPDLEGPRRAFDPQIWRTPDGRLLWTWSENTAPLYAEGLSPYSGASADPTNVRLKGVFLPTTGDPSAAGEPFLIGRGVMMGKPIALRDGRWLLPVANWGEAPSANFLVSDDAGRSFAALGGVTVEDARQRLYDEHYVVACADGGLRTWLRTRGNPGIMVSRSADGGRTWTPAGAANVAHCSSRAFVTRLRNGHLVMVKNGPRDRDIGRKRLTALVSRDEGATWEGDLVLDERDGVSYPDGCQLAEGSLMVVYDRNRRTDREILAVRFREDDILSGKRPHPTLVQGRSSVVGKGMP